MDYLARFGSALFASLAEAAPYLVLGYLLVALFREYVPRETLVRHLGGRGFRPVLNALGIGLALPVCSCGSIPLGVGLVRSGAAQGTTLTFMTSAPAISPVAIVAGYTLLGPALLAAFAATVVVGSVLIGLVGNRVLESGKAEGGEWSFDRAIAPSAFRLPPSPIARLRSAVRWAFWDLGADVSFDLLVGLAVAAAVVAFLPPEWITAWLGQESAWTLLYVILIAIPVYTCTVPSMLVIHSLLLMGASPGAAVAFLVAGPATNLGEINAIRGALGRRPAMFYVVSLVIVALVGGMIVNAATVSGEPPASSSVDRTSPVAANALGELVAGGTWRDVAAAVPAWHYPFMVVLALVLALGVMRRIHKLIR